MRALLDPLFATQNGLDPVSAMPHGLTSSPSCSSASPATSDTKFVCRYAWPGGICTNASCRAPAFGGATRDDALAAFDPPAPLVFSRASAECEMASATPNTNASTAL